MGGCPQFDTTIPESHGHTMSAIRMIETLISPEEYLAGELRSEVRHEYISGRVYAMAGTSVNHNHIAGNFMIELGIHLRGKKCAPFMNDMKVRIREASDETYYYPDVMVNCDPAGQQTYFCDTPALIVEVLSPSTEVIDRREKLTAYRRIPSLHTYILAEQDKREVTVYHRIPQGWEKTILTGADALTVPELEFSISLDAIYARTGL
jgi:Uma2 family endonuclease